MTHSTLSSWEQKAQAKQAAAAALIPAEWRLSPDTLDQQKALLNVLDVPRQCGILSAHELAITETADATALLQKLAARELSAVEVTTAFCKRAAIAQQLTGCLTETFFDVALERARGLDHHLETTGRLVGPLHGLPVSVKESFNIAGVPTSLGFISFLDRPAQARNSALIDILLAAGAVLYVKTNIPQTMMTADSHNNVFGRTLNPHRRTLTAGGSTGGEGALIALRGSLLGAGTDIAGSVRIPALCCGVTGFKPSSGRIPYAGQTSAGRPGLAGGIAPVAGPLCHSMRDAELFVKVVVNAHPDDLDDAALGLSWQEPVPKPTLTIGFLPEDPQCPLHPPMQRHLARAVDKLRAAGHQLVDLTGQLPSLREAKNTAFRFFQMDPDKTQLKHIQAGGEPAIPSLQMTYNLAGTDPEPTLRELYDLNVLRAGVTARVRQVFLKHKLDLVLSAGFQSCAVPHDQYSSAAYTVMWNLVDYPACVLPFGQANESADAASIRDVHYSPEYKPEAVEGAPCHVQLIGRRLKEETLLRNAQIVEKVLKSV